MKWNNGKERAKFEREQKELRKQYLAAGMTEEQIQAMYEFDLEWLRQRRNEAEHTQRLDIESSEEEDLRKDNPLYKKFYEKLAVEEEYGEDSRYGWIKEIENRNLYQVIQKLSEEDKELLTEYVFEGLKQVEIAKVMGIKQPNISRRIIVIKKILKKFL